MTRHLCITVTFLDPLFHGQGDDKPEWPPSPLRLFQALLAGSRTGCREREWSTAHVAAFQWLERRENPVIVAPSAQPAPACTLFVPNNDGDIEFDRQKRLTSKALHPHRLTDGQALHYLWPIPEAEWPEAQPHAELLCAQARHLLALGWGIDQVVGEGQMLTGAQAADLIGHRWLPWIGQQAEHCKWRGPIKGSLEDLERVHQSFMGRVVDRKNYTPPIKPSQFKRVAYYPATMPPPRPFAAFELMEGISFRQENTNQVAAMMRSLICRQEHRTDFRDQFPGDDPEVYLAGHVRGCKRTPPRFSYLPLPTIGHGHADGMIRRVLIADPYGGDGTRTHWAQWRLRNQALRDAEGNERGPLLAPWRPASKPLIARYVNPCRSWSSVTPVILPGFDDGKLSKAERLFLQAASQGGIPPGAIAEFTLCKAPFWPGAQHPCCYSVPNYLDRFARWHVHLRFVDPIAGPLAIGAGRHVGLGLFSAED